MAAAPVALLPEKDAKRVLILGGNFTDFASFSALLQSARILYIPDWNEISRGEARHFDPNVVVCSGEAFRALCSPPVALTTAAGPGLTARQREVLALVAKGLTNREIASVTGLGERVVKGEVADLLALFEASNRTELASLAGVSV
jgi:DNA-binding CsgD family transcriptional regulator